MRRMWTPSEAQAFVELHAGYELKSIQSRSLGRRRQPWLDRRAFWGPLLFVSAVKR